MRKRVNVNNGRWKRICRINSSMHIKKVMCLCAMGWQTLTNQWTDLVPQHLKCYGHSEMPEQSLWSKYLCIIASQICLKQLRFQTAGIHLRKQWPHLFCLVCLLWGANNLIISENYYIQWLLLCFLDIYIASLWGSDDFVLFDLLDGNSACSTNFLCDITILHIS